MSSIVEICMTVRTTGCEWFLCLLEGTNKAKLRNKCSIIHGRPAHHQGLWHKSGKVTTKSPCLQILSYCNMLPAQQEKLTTKQIYVLSPIEVGVNISQPNCEFISRQEPGRKWWVGKEVAQALPVFTLVLLAGGKRSLIFFSCVQKYHYGLSVQYSITY